MFFEFFFCGFRPFHFSRTVNRVDNHFSFFGAEEKYLLVFAIVRFILLYPSLYDITDYINYWFKAKENLLKSFNIHTYVKHWNKISFSCFGVIYR